MEIVCKVEERISQKTGNKYYCLYIPDLERIEMLSKQEMKILTLLYNNKKDSISNK